MKEIDRSKEFSNREKITKHFQDFKLNQTYFISQVRLHHSTGATPVQGVNWCEGYKTFYHRKLRLFIISLSVCPWQAFLA